MCKHKKLVEKFPGQELINKKRGRKALMPEDLIKKPIDMMISNLRLKGAPVTAAIINSVAKGIIKANDRPILVENGGYLCLNHQWGRNLLYRLVKDGKKMGRRKATTAKIPVVPGILTEETLTF